MKDKEYWKRRNAITENVLNSVITVIGTELPSTQTSLSSLILGWDDAMDRLQAELDDK